MESYLGRKLSKEEHVHHKNRIKNDNRVENLEVIDGRVHLRLHQTHKKYSAATRLLDSSTAKDQWKNMRTKMLSATKARPVLALTKEGVLVKKYSSVHSTELDGFNNQHVFEIANGKRKSHKGLIWKYAD